MWIDSTLEFEDAGAVNTGNSDLLQGDVIDLQSLGGSGVGSARDPGNGEPLMLVIQVTTTFTGDATIVAFTLASDAVAAIVPSTSTKHVSIGHFDADDLVAGNQFAVSVPIEGNVYERYLGLLVERNGASTGITAGAINAFLTSDVASWKAYEGNTGTVS